MTAPFVIDELASDHDRSSFSCGVDKIDRFFRETVSQDVRRDYARCFASIETANKSVAGFYTLSASSIRFEDLPEAYRRRLPRYPTVPCALIGWLAVDLQFTKQGIGSMMVADAIRRVSASDIAAFAILADAIDETAAQFYRRHAFTELNASDRRFILPMRTARAAMPANPASVDT